MPGMALQEKTSGRTQCADPDTLTVPTGPPSTRRPRSSPSSSRRSRNEGRHLRRQRLGRVGLHPQHPRCVNAIYKPTVRAVRCRRQKVAHRRPGRIGPGVKFSKRCQFKSREKTGQRRATIVDARFSGYTPSPSGPSARHYSRRACRNGGGGEGGGGAGLAALEKRHVRARGAASDRPFPEPPPQKAELERARSRRWPKPA